MKKKTILMTEGGFALITTLLMGILSMAVLVVAVYMIAASARLGGANKRYSVELDIAKGVSGYIMAQIRGANLLCGGTTCTPTNSSIDLSPLVCAAMGKTNACTGLSAIYLSENVFTDPVTPPGASYPPRYNFYSARITSVNAIGEQAIVDFVYKVTD